jgi:hypothetical protein
MVERLLVPPDVTFPFSLGTAVSRKTTLSRMVFAQKPYVTVEDPDQLQFALSDERGFLQHFPNGNRLCQLVKPHGIDGRVRMPNQNGHSIRPYVATRKRPKVWLLLTAYFEIP